MVSSPAYIALYAFLFEIFISFACFGCLLVYLLLSDWFLQTNFLDVDTLRLFSIFGFQGTDSYLGALFPGSSGDGEIRTLDPLLARQVLSQLSYAPISDGSLVWFSGNFVLSNLHSRSFLRQWA